jgi:transketolase
MTNIDERRISPFAINRAMLIIALGMGSLTLALAADPPAKPVETAANLEAFRAEIALTRSNIVLTLEQLDLMRHSEDPHAQYQKYVEQLAKMKEMAKVTRERAQLMKKKGDAYFADWENRTDNNRPTEATLSKRKASYDMIISLMQQARENFGPLIDRLEKIKTLLEGERSKEKVAAAKDHFMEANWRCADVQRALMMIEGRLDSLAAELTGKERSPSSDPGKR